MHAPIKTTGLLFVSLLLAGCGVGVARKSGAASTSTVTNTANFAVSAFSPASGDVNRLPTSVVVVFNQANIASNVSTPSYYNLSCSGNVFQASSVQYTAGQNFVTVQLPSVGAVNAGTICYFSISPNIANTDGYTTVGSRSAAYNLINGQSLAGNPISAAVGGTGGVGFTENGATLELLSGLNLNTSTSVLAIQGLWQENFRSGGTIVGGAVHGDQTVSPNQNFNCPAGMRITGLKGRAGSYVLAIGIVCKDSSQATYWESSIAGAAGGGNFSISCPAGTFATGLAGRSGSYLDQIALVCQ